MFMAFLRSYKLLEIERSGQGLTRTILLGNRA